MPRTFLVQIDVDRLRANLAKQESRPISRDDALRWLADAGFTQLEGWWQVSESDLGQLDPEEVTAARPLSTTEEDD